MRLSLHLYGACQSVGRSRALSFLVLTATALVAGGCGYSHQERTAALPEHIQSVYIEPWDNRSNEFLLSTWITDELRNEFLRGSALSLASREEADIILEGEVVKVITAGLSYIRYDRAVERSITVECSARILDGKTGAVLWQTTNLIREENFFVGRTVQITEGFKDEALTKISRYLAETIYHRVAGIY